MKTRNLLFLLSFSIVSLVASVSLAQNAAPAQTTPPAATQQAAAQPAPQQQAAAPVDKTGNHEIMITQTGVITYKGKDSKQVITTDKVREGAPYATGSANPALCESWGLSKTECNQFQKNPRFADITIVPQITKDGKILISGIYIAYDKDGKFMSRRIIYSLLNNGDKLTFRTNRDNNTSEKTTMTFTYFK